MPEFQEGAHPENPNIITTRDSTHRDIIQWYRTHKDRGILPIATAIALSALTLLPEARPVNAAEIQPDASWADGVASLRNNTLHEGHEVGATFALLKDGTGRWFDYNVGDLLGVEIHPTLEKAKISGDLAKGRVEKICQLHTHPLASAELFGRISTDQGIKARQQGEVASASFPPSKDDISISSFEKIANAYKGGEFEPDKSYIQAVAAPGEFWFYRMAGEDDIRKDPDYYQEFQERRRIAQEWMTMKDKRLTTLSDDELGQYAKKIKGFKYDEYHANYGPQDFREIAESEVSVALMQGNPDIATDFFKTPEEQKLQTLFSQAIEDKSKRDKEWYANAIIGYAKKSPDGKIDEEGYNDLRRAYLRLGAVVRRVPYDQLYKEPICAGVDYDPKVK